MSAAEAAHDSDAGQPDAVNAVLGLHQEARAESNLAPLQKRMKKIARAP